MVRYALARSVAERNNYEWSINKIPSHDYFHGVEQMHFFNLDYGVENSVPYGKMPEGTTSVWSEKYIEYDNGVTFYPYQPDVFDVQDNTYLRIHCAHDARYFDRNKIMKWFEIDARSKEASKSMLSTYDMDLDDDNLCIINCRGGEYKGIGNLFIGTSYYVEAIHRMADLNSDMRFVVITDDPEYFKTVFNFPVYHFGISTDYYAINNAKHLILSNSGFAIFPTWTNENVKNVIAPMYWARHNIGVFANSHVWTFGKEASWNFIDKQKRLFTYKEVEEKMG